MFLFSRRCSHPVFFFLLFCCTGAANAAPSIEEINRAEYKGSPLPPGQSGITARIQILLDRNGSSPGVIDGKSGENVADAIRGFEEMQDLPADGVMDEKVWEALQDKGRPALMKYKVQAGDVEKIKKSNPDDYREMAKEDWLGFTSGSEALAEKFHMDENFLKALNPGRSFKEGDSIVVADPGEDRNIKVSRLDADKSRSRLIAYDKEGKIVLSYPTSIGSAEMPSPSGDVTVKGVARNPTYTYKPENMPEKNIDEELTIPPGPNGPVGLVWIDLSKPTYGIHGTAEPAKIGKTSSHGCIRLTNWDALELAHAIEPGAHVRFTSE